MISDTAQTILKKHAERAAENRRSMPQVTAWVDQTREHFPGARVIFAQEGGKTVGKPLPAGVVPILQTTAAPRARADDMPTSKHAAVRAATQSNRTTTTRG